MSDVTGKLVKVEFDVDVEKQAGGTYKAWRIVYEDSKGDIKSIAKPMGGLQYLPGLKNGLEGLSSGDTFTMERQQKGDYQNPVKIYKSDGAASQATTASQPAVRDATPATTGHNTFEVNNQLKEKQMKFDVLRQPIYVRQTALKAASELSTIFKLKTPEDVLNLSKRFVTYIETGETGMIEDMVNDDIDIE